MIGSMTVWMLVSLTQMTLGSKKVHVWAVNDLWDVNPASHNLCWDDANETQRCILFATGKWLDESQLQKGFNE